jgi:hypothetical protein
MVQAKLAFMLKTRKAQAAMEFLMTYGWAILVVLAAISALAYFGVLSPSKFLPESCTLSATSGMACLDFRVDSASAVVMVINSGGRDVTLNNVSIGSCYSAFNTSFPDGTSLVLTLSGCSFGSPGKKMRQDFILSYTDIYSGFTKEASGSITSMVH